jgi:hypothetical protein
MACLLAPLSVRAADGESTVTGMGMSSIEKQADTLRMQMDLQVEGPTLKDALEKLKARREAIKSGLAKLGATESSFVAADTRTVEAEGGNNRAAMERMIRERMAGRGGAGAAGAPKTVSVSCNIKMDWPLKGGTAEELLMAAGTIREQIKSSKLLETPKSPAQEEAAAEAAAEASFSDEPAANEPMFMFVAKVTEAEQAKATAEAFTKARESAGRLAKAAGSELGVLRSLSGQGTSDSSDYQNYYGGGNASMRYYYQQMMVQRAQGGDNSEVFAMQPGKVTQSIMVQAEFALK